MTTALLMIATALTTATMMADVAAPVMIETTTVRSRAGTNWCRLSPNRGRQEHGLALVGTVEIEGEWARWRES